MTFSSLPRKKTRPANRTRAARRPEEDLTLKILCLSAEVGAGHTAAARAIACAFEDMSGTLPPILDAYRFAAAPISQLATHGYVEMVKRFPRLYRLVHSRAEQAAAIGPFRRWTGRYAAHNLRRHLAGARPDAVVCTHAFACGLMAQYKQRYEPNLPVIAVITDFTAHPFWLHRGIDAYAVASHEMKVRLVERGLDPGRILVSGIPIKSGFNNEHRPQSELRAALGLPEDRYIAVIMGGGLGLGPSEAILRELAQVQLPITAVVIAGKNQACRVRLRNEARRLGVAAIIVGFVPNVEEYLRAADVLITKPGGLTCAEALTSGVPMILIAPLPGPEEDNATFLSDRGAAFYCRRANELGQLITTVFVNPAARAGLSFGAEGLRAPDAAADIVRRVVELGSAAAGGPPRPARIVEQRRRAG